MCPAYACAAKYIKIHSKRNLRIMRAVLSHNAQALRALKGQTPHSIVEPHP